MALFESYERRIDKINEVLAGYGISSIEEAQQITKDAGLDVYNQIKGIQPICFENACWAYIVGAAIDALDIMCKTADVELASWERKLGGRLVTIIVEGDVSAVTEAVNAAATGAIKKPVSYAVIARPHEEIVRMVELSASRWKNNQGDE